jgi:hypothetical protein
MLPEHKTARAVALALPPPTSAPILLNVICALALLALLIAVGILSTS